MHNACGKPGKKATGSEVLPLSGWDLAIFALPVWEAEGKPDTSISCLLTMKDPRPDPAGDRGSMETLLDIIIYGALVTLETT